MSAMSSWPLTVTLVLWYFYDVIMMWYMNTQMFFLQKVTATACLNTESPKVFVTRIETNFLSYSACRLAKHLVKPTYLFHYTIVHSLLVTILFPVVTIPSIKTIKTVENPFKPTVSVFCESITDQAFTAIHQLQHSNWCHCYILWNHGLDHCEIIRSWAQIPDLCSHSNK